MLKEFCLSFVATLSLWLPLEGVLDYPTAAQRVLEKGNTLILAETDLGIKNSDVWQASLLPNPSLSVQYDSFGGNHTYHGWGNLDFSVTLSQLILMGGKRQAAITSASYRTWVVAWEAEIQKQDLLFELLQAFIDAALAQEKEKLAETQYQMAQDALTNIKDKGKTTLLDIKKAEIAVLSGKLSSLKAHGASDAARRKIASLWGVSEPDFEEVSFALMDIQPPQPLPVWEELLQQTPETFKAIAERWFAYATKVLEKTKRVPDIDLSAGFSTCNHWDDYSFSIAIGVPLPVFDQNQAGICRAEWEEWQTIYGWEGLHENLIQKLTDAHQRWLQAYQEAKKLQDLSSQTAQEALKFAEEEFRQKKIAWDDVVDAKKMVLEIRSDFLDAAAEYHKARSEVLRLAAAL